MTALLGLLGWAGYQNRDKLAELLEGATGNTAQPWLTRKTSGWTAWQYRSELSLAVA
jgi:hypothetical protein